MNLTFDAFKSSILWKRSQAVSEFQDKMNVTWEVKGPDKEMKRWRDGSVIKGSTQKGEKLSSEPQHQC